MITHTVKLRSQAGDVLHYSLPFAAMNIVISEMQVGSLAIAVPGGLVDPLWFTPDARLEVWRRVDDGLPQLFGGQWLINLVRISGNSENITAEAVDFNALLDRRIIDYPATTPEIANAYSDKSGAADNLIKAFVRENIGALATDTARRLADLTVTADVSLAPSVAKQASRKNLLSTLQDIASDSLTKGTYLTWGWSFVENAFTFDTRTNQWGVNHGSTSTDTLIISREMANLLDPVITDDYSNEVNVAKVGGEGEGSARVIGSASSTRATAGMFSRREYFTSGTYTDNVTTLNSEAAAVLSGRRARRTLTGKIAETSTMRYGVHLNYGDMVVAEYAGKTFNCRLSTVTAKVEGGIETELKIQLRGEEVI